MVSLNDLVPKNHEYRRILELLDFKKLCTPLQKMNKNTNSGAYGYGIERLFKCIFLQFYNDLSDRELGKYLEENNAFKFFCGFNLIEKTPHFTLYTKVRNRIGTKKLSKIFQKIKKGLQKQGYMSEIFTFVDATHIIRKNNLWEERDKAKAAKYKKLNNKVLPKVSFDKEARIGCKGKNKFWYGYKQHTSVDMQSGMINKIAITPANITDAQGLKHICPNKGAVYGDKGYCLEPSRKEIKRKGCHDATIKKNNMKNKNKDLDKRRSKMRSPYERVFSKRNKRAKYCGLAKNQFSAFLYAISHNIKRSLVLGSPPLELAS